MWKQSNCYPLGNNVSEAFREIRMELIEEKTHVLIWESWDIMHSFCLGLKTQWIIPVGTALQGSISCWIKVSGTGSST